MYQTYRTRLSSRTQSIFAGLGLAYPALGLDDSSLHTAAMQ